MSKEVSNREQIARRLRDARDAAGLTQSQVAAKLGIHRPTMSEIEAGRRRVSAEELASLAEIYGVEIGWLTNAEPLSKKESDKILIAARQLSKLKDKDLDRLMNLVNMLRGSSK